MQPLLPQNDPRPEARNDALAKKREQYRYNYTINPPLAMADSVPFHDQPSLGWLALGAVYVVKLLKNNRLAAESIEHKTALTRAIDALAVLGRGIAANPDQILQDAKAAVESVKLKGRPSSIDDYGRLFQSIVLPPIAATFRDDAAFAENFISATNPLIIERVRTIDPARFPITEEQFQAALGPAASLASYLAAGRLFFADYAMLDGAQTGTYAGSPKYIYAPIVLFAVSDTGRLTPVAIQLEQKPGEGNPIFLPVHGVNWSIAKLLVMVADCNVSALYFHQARTHMVVEPIVIATHRQLSVSHPLHVLLDPHFEGTLYINSLGQKTVFSPGGTIETISAATRDSFRALAVSAVKGLPFPKVALPVNLAERGVDESSSLREYPYRDDGLLVWNAIDAWVREYVALYYRGDADVAADTELQAWVAELVSENGGRLVDFGDQGGMKTVATLVTTLTTILFTSSAQHWALNGPLSTLMAYVPYYPIAAYSPRPTATSGATEADFLAALPPLDQAQLQFGASYFMGSVRYTTLGDYSRGHFADDRVGPVLAAFQMRLNEIEATIAARNQSRRTPYPYMRPSVIPQSINI